MKLSLKSDVCVCDWHYHQLDRANIMQRVLSVGMRYESGSLGTP